MNDGLWHRVSRRHCLCPPALLRAATPPRACLPDREPTCAPTRRPGRAHARGGAGSTTVPPSAFASSTAALNQLPTMRPHATAARSSPDTSASTLAPGSIAVSGAALAQLHDGGTHHALGTLAGSLLPTGALSVSTQPPPSCSATRPPKWPTQHTCGLCTTHSALGMHGHDELRSAPRHSLASHPRPLVPATGASSMSSQPPRHLFCDPRAALTGWGAATRVDGRPGLCCLLLHLRSLQGLSLLPPPSTSSGSSSATASAPASVRPRSHGPLLPTPCHWIPTEASGWSP